MRGLGQLDLYWENFCLLDKGGVYPGAKNLDAKLPEMSFATPKPIRNSAIDIGLAGGGSDDPRPPHSPLAGMAWRNAQQQACLSTGPVNPGWTASGPAT